MAQLFFLDGACATGKTTLIDYYRLHHSSNLQIVSDIARHVFLTQDIPHNEHHTLATQKLIQHEFIKHVSEALNSAKPVLVDSSPFTSIGYAKLTSQDGADELLANVKTFSVENALFIIPNPHDIEYVYDPKDSVRTETPEERLQVHHYLLGMYKELQFNYTIISGSVQERVNQINNIIFPK